MTITYPSPPQPFEIDCIRHVVSHLEGLEETLGGIDATHFGPDFQKARDAAYVMRRYLEIELTQYESLGDEE